MTVLHRDVFRKSAMVAAVLMGAHAGFGQTSDSTLESATRLIHRAMVTSRDTALGQNTDAAQTIAALRTSKDVELLPLFEKLRESKVVDNQIYAMVSIALLTKDPKRIDLKLLFSGGDPVLAASGIDALIDQSVLTSDQLTSVLTMAPDGAQKVLAAAELSKRGELKDRSVLMDMLRDEKDMVRYYAAITLLESKDSAEVTAGQNTLKLLTNKKDPRHAPVQALMLVRAQQKNLAAAVPWATQIAGDADADEGLRYTAVAALLALKGEEGPRILAEMINQQHDTIQQVKLGLISIEYAKGLKPEIFDPLVKSRSTLAKTIGQLAQSAATGVDNTEGVVALIKEGHPIILDWALAYTDRIDGSRRLAIRKAVISQATIVDNVRDRDYERAAVAAQNILDGDGAPGRDAIKELINSDNRAVVEAVLAGLYRSKAENQSELVMKVWDGLTRTSSTEVAANYAALILAREGKKEPLTWLPGMVVGGTVQAGGGQGLRALAAWYYVKLKGQTGELLKSVLAD